MEFEDFIDTPVVKAAVKPKRKYVRKATNKINDFNEDTFLSRHRTFSNKAKYCLTSSGFKSKYGTLKSLNDYLKNVISYLRKDNEIEVAFSLLHNECNYACYEVNIFDYDPHKTNYTRLSLSFKIEELHSNCSSVGIHHFSGPFIRTRDTYSTEVTLFENQQTFEKFMVYLEELILIMNYSNILYTISNESNKALSEFVSKTAKEIDRFKNKRSTREIVYYSKRV